MRKETKNLTGFVHWFDNNSGEGIIKDGKGNSYYVHRNAIASKNKVLKDKSKVIFDIIEDTTFSQVTKVQELI